MLTHLSLFTGISGLDLAAEWAGFTTVGQCEYADYPTKVLEKHWPYTPRWRDIRELTAEDFYRRTGRRTVDLVSGGFPCQPFSVAGNQKGKADDRYLWPEMSRVISDIKPTWVFGENVPGILSIAADDVCKDLEREGYEVVIFNFEAAAVGAKHRRERVFFVAYSRCPLRQRELFRGEHEKEDRERNANKTERPSSISEFMAYTESTGSQGWFSKIVSECSDKRIIGESGTFVSDTNQVGCRGVERREHEMQLKDGCWWSVEPDVGRVANGIPSRVDRLKCLGNAVVPQQVYPILKAIYDIEVQNGL